MMFLILVCSSAMISIVCCVQSSFADQIQSEYYGGNRSVSIEGIALEHFSAAPQSDINSSTLSRPRHAVFHYFFI